MKTSELIGPALDWAVAKALGWVDYPTDSIEQGSKWHCDAEKAPFGKVMWKSHFQPSASWSWAGPIIDQEKIDLSYDGETGIFSAKHPAFRPKKRAWVSGPTPLIAAMRAFVASKLGDDEVEIPEELLIL